MKQAREMTRLEYLRYWIRFLVDSHIKNEITFAIWIKGFEDRYSEYELSSMEDMWYEEEEPVSPNSEWIHRNKIFYKVLFVANQNSGDNPKRYEKYPPTVVYENKYNKKKYTGRLDDWHRRMLRVG